MPARRDSDEARKRWGHLVQTVGQSRDVRGVILDKTQNGSVSSHLEQFGVKDRLEVIPRPFHESMFASLATVRVRSDDHVQQFHDDDWWGGCVSLGTKSAGHSFMTRVEIQRRPVASASVRRAKRHMSVYLGAIRGDLWNRFADYCSSLGAHSSATLDIAQATATRVGGLTDGGRDFVYEYDNRHWLNKSASTSTSMRLAEQAGWGDLSSEDTLLIGTAIDALAALGYVAEICDKRKVRQAVQRILHRMPPRHRRRVRLSELISRSLALENLESAVRLQEISDLSGIMSVLTHTMSITSVRGLQDEYLPWFRASVHEEIANCCDAWGEGIGRLQRAIEV